MTCPQCSSTTGTCHCKWMPTPEHKEALKKMREEHERRLLRLSK